MRLRKTASEIKEMIRQEIAYTIDGHRASRSFSEEEYTAPVGAPTDKELNDFIRSNWLLDSEMIDFLTYDSLPGFESRICSIRAEEYQELCDNIESWANNETWLGGDLIYIDDIKQPEPVNSHIWHPENQIIQPKWVENSPSALLIAADILKQGKLLTEMNWRDFEKLIADLLEKEGWTVELTKGSKDGGIDVIAIMSHPELGLIKSLWQAKKYSSKNKVQLSKVRELSGIVEKESASKGMIVTTSSLTSGALEWIKQDEYRLGYKDHDALKKWIFKSI